MASECSTSFAIRFLLRIDAEITLGDIYADLRPGSDTIYYWRVRFTYVTGKPAATAFRLNSADGLTGTFDPSTPVASGDRSEVRSGVLEGTVGPIVIAPNDSVTYNGTITIIQA